MFEEPLLPELPLGSRTPTPEQVIEQKILLQRKRTHDALEREIKTWRDNTNTIVSKSAIEYQNIISHASEELIVKRKQASVQVEKDHQKAKSIIAKHTVVDPKYFHQIEEITDQQVRHDADKQLVYARLNGMTEVVNVKLFLQAVCMESLQSLEKSVAKELQGMLNIVRTNIGASSAFLKAMILPFSPITVPPMDDVVQHAHLHAMALPRNLNMYNMVWYKAVEHLKPIYDKLKAEIDTALTYLATEIHRYDVESDGNPSVPARRVHPEDIEDQLMPSLLEQKTMVQIFINKKLKKNFDAADENLRNGNDVEQLFHTLSRTIEKEVAGSIKELNEHAKSLFKEMILVNQKLTTKSYNKPALDN